MRIVTWNLWWRFGPWEERRKAILHTLREVDPDIVGLQEVWREGGENLAAQLAEELGLHWAWAPAGMPPHWGRRIEDPNLGVGNAVLSRWPIEATEVRALPSAGGPEEGRVALHTRIASPHGAVPFFTTHLHSPPFGSAIRCEQVRELARFVGERYGNGPIPAIVTGDFNAEADSDELRLFGGSRTAPVVPGQVMIDVWRYAEPGAPWASWDPRNEYLRHPAVFPSRIDYIHVGLPGPRGVVGVRSVGLAGDGPVGGVWPSDHLAVVADLIPPEELPVLR
ncbi:hypothetical protein GCM10027160_48630 [Streptomyces calidiresistens]|uniref:Endonuclease n=1 Tax=Streptomyces calidiresistens TaxID=1485586 RepID=A0A7W3T6X2_9ACTN|nr:endonuclease/exonuclease/phosphatase family protein [Streptomyces calidiresistens]MBB0232060.1 endonuclease [Streptomyces calidiresistens]